MKRKPISKVALNTGKNNYIFAPLYDVISIGVIKGKNADDLALPIQRVHKNQTAKFVLEDFLYLANILGLNELEVKQELRKILLVFIEKFPNYIEKTKELLELDELSISKSRDKKTNLINKLQNFYDERLIALRKSGFFEELGVDEDII